VSETINKAKPTVTLSASPNPAALGASVTITATLSSTISGVAPTGTVQFSVDGKQAGTGTLSGGGTATYSTSTLAAGAHSISATYSGDGNYLTASSTSGTETVNKATPMVTLSATPNPAALGANVTFTATVSTTISGVAPTGTVQFSVDGKQSGKSTLSGGKATYSTSTLTAGTHSTSATYSGDGNYVSATSATGSLTVTK
jgi:hypothetical protein